MSSSALAVVSRFGSASALLSDFNPGNQILCTKDVSRAYGGSAPSLAAVGEAFGAGTSRSWLVIQLDNLSEFAGCKDKLSISKLEELANIILTECGYLKLTELMDFFRRFKAGEYGKFYGSVDPMVITCALRDFLKQRHAILSRLEHQRLERQKWEDPDYVLYRRQTEAYKRKRIFYARNFHSPDFSFDEFSQLWWLFNMGYERKDHGYIES